MPASPITGEEESETVRYAITHKILLKIIILFKSIFSPNFPYMTLETPISTAKSVGPAISPTAFDTPSAFSAKVEAHWLIDSSLAPEQHITSRNTQKSFIEKSCFKDNPFSPFSSSVAIGTLVNIIPFTTGTIAQSTAIILQLCTPNTEKNSVDSKITPTLPQQ